MGIIFSRHSERKFKVLARHGISWKRDEVIETIRKPDRKFAQLPDKTIYQKRVAEALVMRVVTKIKDEKIFVITFYPGKRGRYED